MLYRWGELFKVMDKIEVYKWPRNKWLTACYEDDFISLNTAKMVVHILDNCLSINIIIKILLINILLN